jgi:hypothetical protein
MKDETTTYLFDDGTEPTVRRLPKGCDQQGRFPEAAEAATEVGQDDPDFYGREFYREELKAVLLCGVAVVAVVGGIAFLVGRFA